MSQPPSSPPASQQSQASSSGSKARLDEQTRFWTLYYLGQARIQLNTSPDDCSITTHARMSQLMVDSGKNLRIPHFRTVGRLWKSVSTTGIITPKKTTKKRRTHLDQQVTNLLKSGLSVRETASRLGPGQNVSHTTVHRISKASKLYPYRKPQGQKLTQDHIDRRLEAANIFHQMFLEKKTVDLEDVLFTDECIIGVGDTGNRQNDRFWRNKGEFIDAYSVMKHRSYQGSKTHIWVGIHSVAGVIGPFFVEDIPNEEPSDKSKTLTASKYVRLLKDHVLPALKAKLTLDQLRRSWYQQDGARVHTATESMNSLSHVFGAKIISLQADVKWPACSPDMSPLDYWFWSFMKLSIEANQPGTIDELRVKIAESCADISAADCRRAISDFNYRIQALQATRGAHFEHTFKSFKAQLRRRQETCDYCESVHPCDCADCDAQCCNDMIERLEEAINNDSDSD